MVSSEDAITIYGLLALASILVWLTGGWGIDALLRAETRPPKDLDVLVLLEDVPRLCELMARQGYSLGELWSENRWVVDAGGAETASAFVLQDPTGPPTRCPRHLPRRPGPRDPCLGRRGPGL